MYKFSDVIERKFVPFCGDVKEIVTRNDIVYTSPPAMWLDGIYLGNGDFGAMVHGPHDNLTFSFSKADLWDLRYNKNQSGLSFEKLKTIIKTGDREEYEKYARYYMNYNPTWGYPSPQPAGFLRLCLCEGANAGNFEQRLNLYDGICEHSFCPVGDFPTKRTRPGFNKPFKIESFVHADRNLFVIRIIPNRQNAGPFRLMLGRPLRPDGRAPSFSVNSGTGQMNYRLPEGRNYMVSCKTLEVSCKWSIAGKMLVGLCESPPDGEIAIFVSIATSDKNNAVSLTTESNDLISECSTMSFGSLRKGHTDWWNSFWSKSHIILPNKKVEKFWYTGVYCLGACSRKGKQLHGLQGIWWNQNTPPWNGDYHADINVQTPFWQCCTGNRLELAEPYYRHYLKSLKQAVKDTNRFYKLPGVKFPLASDPLGREIGGYMTTSHWPCVSAWICENFWCHWEYSGDLQFLRNVAWPVIRESSLFIKAYLTEGKDGKFHISPTNLPEAWCDKFEAWGSDSPMDLALIKKLFGMVIETADILGVGKGLSEELKNILKKLYSYPGTLQSGITIMKDRIYDGNDLRNLYYKLFGVYPSGVMKTEGKTREAKLVRKTYRSILRCKVKDEGYLSNSCWGTVITAIAARMKDGETAWKFLRNWSGKILRNWDSDILSPAGDSNGLMKAGSYLMQIDGTTSYPAGVNETLIQSYEGIICLFPAVPKNFNGSFHSFRTKGGFLISSRMEKGKVTDVVIKSMLGGECRIQNPFTDCIVVRIDSGKKHVVARGNKMVLSFSTEKKSVYSLSKRNSNVRQR